MEDGKKGKVRVVGQVPLIDGLRTPYHLFRDKFMHANQPVLISGLMLQWPAFRLWSSPSGLPNLDYLTSLFGSSQVQVAECSMRDFTDQKRVDMTVSEYIAYWKGLNSNTQNADSVESLLYLKDWHFVKDYPEYCAYTTPTFFMDDWLNFYLEHHQLHASDTQGKAFGCLSDYRFVYMGPKGTWTPLHADVLRSYSWSGNVCGKKLWHLLPPSETHHLYDRHRRNTVYDIYGDVLVKEFPNFHQAGWLECIQERGQILFVPSGWYHQVTNLEDAISINHNWFNGYNLHWVLELLLADYEEAKASIEDIRSIADDFEELCQRNLAANSGDRETFFCYGAHVLLAAFVELHATGGFRIGSHSLCFVCALLVLLRLQLLWLSAGEALRLSTGVLAVSVLLVSAALLTFFVGCCGIHFWPHFVVLSCEAQLFKLVHLVVYLVVVDFCGGAGCNVATFVANCLLQVVGLPCAAADRSNCCSLSGCL